MVKHVEVMYFDQVQPFIQFAMYDAYNCKQARNQKPTICSLSSRYSCMENKLVDVFTQQVNVV